jgi:hypothetical protein
LQTLDLSDTGVTDAGLKHLAGLTALQELILWTAGVTDAGLKELKGLKDLRVLALRGPQVTDAGLVHLKGLKKLERLTLSGTRVTDAGVKAIKEAIPGLKVVAWDNTLSPDAFPQLPGRKPGEWSSSPPSWLRKGAEHTLGHVLAAILAVILFIPILLVLLIGKAARWTIVAGARRAWRGLFSSSLF